MNNYQEEIYNVKPSTIAVRDSVLCHKCGAESGWVNDDLRAIKRNLNCKNCGKVCIKYLAGYVQTSFVSNLKKEKTATHKSKDILPEINSETDLI